ncbi:MAG: hypothetical protein H7222_00885 [Methylotenera sp.]|nr:hypothetical protein [Oligoflexia bacterium]
MNTLFGGGIFMDILFGIFAMGILAALAYVTDRLFRRHRRWELPSQWSYRAMRRVRRARCSLLHGLRLRVGQRLSVKSPILSS